MLPLDRGTGVAWSLRRNERERRGTESMEMMGAAERSIFFLCEVSRVYIRELFATD